VSLSADAFFLDNPPAFLQQGDIAADVPLVTLPSSERLVLVRSSHFRLPLDHLKPGEAALVDERALSDAYEIENEYTVVSVQRGYAMLATPTCDLDDDQEDAIWTAWPISPVEGSGLDIGNLKAGKYANFYLLPEHEHLGGATFISVTDLRPVRPQQFQLKNRVASITREAQDEIARKFTRAQGRSWGYREGETIQPLGRYETGEFRCAQCNVYDVAVSHVTLKAGDTAPECPNCQKIGKAAQWYPLTKHRKS